MTNNDHIQQWCKEYGVSLIVRTEYHLTLSNGSSRMDIYISKKGIKYHDVAKNKRGTIGRLIEFLDAWLDGVNYKEPALFDVLLDLYKEYLSAPTIVKKNYAQIKIETILKER